MRHPERLEDYLDHIAEAITRATGYVQPLQGIEELEKNQLVQDAVVRNIEIIGEAATNINRIAPDYIHFNPVKHGPGRGAAVLVVSQISDDGAYPLAWTGKDDAADDRDERR
jgi:hypothetical protein